MAELIIQIKNDCLHEAHDMGEKLTLICHWAYGYEVKA